MKSRWFIKAGVATLAVVTLSLIAVFAWRSSVPSASARRLAKMLEQREPVADASNAYIYMMGIEAPEGADPFALGAKRWAWMESRSVDPGDETPDPLPASTGDPRTPALRGLARMCNGTRPESCAEAFREWPRDVPPAPGEAALLARYETLIRLPRWLEAVPYSADMPLAPFSKVLDGMRLEFLKLRTVAASGDAAKVRDTLQRDLVFWREVLKDSDLLISKMIAVAAIRSHFFYGNLVMRELPEGRRKDAIPPCWAEAFTPAELSMLRIAAGEYEFTRVVVRRSGSFFVGEGDGDYDSDDDTPIDRIFTRLRGRVRTWQRELNKIADLYLETAEAYAAPLDQYLRIDGELRKRFSRGQLAIDFTNYALRIATVEGMRRAALLMVELRAEGVKPGDMAARIGAATLRNPFTQTPFKWDEAQAAVVYEGPERHRARTHVFVY